MTPFGGPPFCIETGFDTLLGGSEVYRSPIVNKSPFAPVDMGCIESVLVPFISLVG